MRYAILFIIISSVIAAGIFYQFATFQRILKVPQTSPKNPSPSPLTIQNQPPTTIIKYNNKSFALYIEPIINTANLTLISNFTQKKSSQEIMEENNCRYGVNGGFYTTDDKPLGLFVADKKEFSSSLQSALLSGFFYNTTDNTIHISTTPPENPVAFALQSGPYFTSESVLKIRDDEYARRMLVAVDENGKLYFIAITEEENIHSGPLLADLPRIVSLIPNSLFLIHNSLFLNLDGGSASAFYSQSGTKLMEITAIGSLLCGK